MKKFVFSLEKVLGYKRQMLDLRKNELFRLQAQQNDMERQIADRSLEFGDTNRRLTLKMRDGVVPHDIAVYKGYMEDLNRRIRVLRGQRQKIMETIAAKQQEIVRMNSDISGLERLKDKQQNLYRSCEKKELERTVEEFVGRAKVQAG